MARNKKNLPIVGKKKRKAPVQGPRRHGAVCVHCERLGILKLNCTIEHRAATPARPATTTPKRRRKPPKPPNPRQVKRVKSPTGRYFGLNANDSRSFLASLRVDDAANEISQKPNPWRLGKGPASS